MNAVHYHLLLNHIPVLGTLFGLALLLVAIARRSEELKRVAFGCLVVTALLGIPAFLTGEPTEKAVAGLPDVSRKVIHQHEEVAEAAFVSLLILGAVTLGILVGTRRKSAVPRWMGAAVLAGSLLVTALMAWTANLGGQVRRPEIRWSGPAGTASEGARAHSHLKH